MTKIIPGTPSSSYEKWDLPDVSRSKQATGVGRSHNALTAKQIETLQKQAYDEAYQRGYNDGYAKLAEKINRFDKILSLLNKPLLALDEQVESELIKLALLTARHLVRREIKVDKGQIIAVIREAISQLPVSMRNVKIHLHPEDLNVVRDIMNSDLDESKWKLIEDPSISQGGCKVITEVSMIDATLESRLTSIAATLLGGLREDDNEPIS